MALRRLSAFALSVLSFSAHSSDWPIHGALIDDLSVINAPAGGHRVGNIEVSIQGGFAVGPLNCSSVYLTIGKAEDPEKRLFSLLLLAKALNKPLVIMATDDQSIMAFPGRCSVRYATIK